MPRLRLRHPDVPTPLQGWILVDRFGLPRYWATIWSDVLKAGIDEGTRGVYLAAVERFYQSVITQTGEDILDRMLAGCEFQNIESALSGFLTSLRNSSAVGGVDHEATWRYALTFVQDTLQYMSHGSESR